jgi:hypothetical protein
MNTIQLTETELDCVSGGRASHGSDVAINMVRVQNIVAAQTMNDHVASRLMHAMQDTMSATINKIGH